MKYLSTFKDLFASIECPIHHQKPEIVKADDGELQILCCCGKFRKECLFLIEKIAPLLAKE